MTKKSISELFQLNGQVAFVTGAALGIGAAIAQRLAEAGATVMIADEKDAHATVESIRSSGGKAYAQRCDISQVHEIEQSIHATIKQLGRLDIVVNNAGIFPMAPVLDVTEALWDRVLNTNLKGAFFLAQCAARQMIQQGHGGSIINIASIDAIHPTGALAHYDASKGGLMMLTKSLAREFASSKIRVNSIAPGAIETPGANASLSTMAPGVSIEAVYESFMSRIPLGRMGQPDEIATAVLFLASNAASYMTGSMLLVDGGYLLS